ncbi:alkaline phosphatase family protein [Microbacterium sp. gxy059]|uniref:alkaline phosphatase family protein n=1 Tax=Microbacterium sp. gxy059 TaxID=2957199 RepID=UPI003D95F19A
MTSILPTGPASARELAGVAPAMLRSLSGEGDLPEVRSAILFVVDGLGAIALRAHRAHARFLGQAMAKKDVARSVFPSTTAAALTTLLTGADPGAHGLVGYRVLDPDRDVLANQLNGYERDGLDAEAWQLAPTIFERAAEMGATPYAVSAKRYEATGFTRAVLRGADVVGEDDPAARVRLACAIAAQSPGAFVYCYLPELDQAGHPHGVDSDAWRAALEQIDQALSAVRTLPGGVGAIATSDHGMVDVPRHRHVLLQEGDPRLAGVRHLGGEPRLLHVYAEEGVDAAALADVWRASSGAAADVVTRDEAIEAGLFGARVDPRVRVRIGDVLVAARGLWAFYDDRLRDKAPQRMIGQHGSVTPEETIVPFVRIGAYAR